MSGIVSRFVMFGTGSKEGDRWLTGAVRLMGRLWGLTHGHHARGLSAMTSVGRKYMWDDPDLESMIAETLCIPFILRTSKYGPDVKEGHFWLGHLASFVMENPEAVKRMLPAMESALHTVNGMKAGATRLGLLDECCPGVGDDTRWALAYHMHYPVWLTNLDTIIVDKRRAFLEFACRHLITAPVRCEGGWERIVTAAVTGYVSLPIFPGMPRSWDASDPDLLERMMGAHAGREDGIGPSMAWSVPEGVVLQMDFGPCDPPSMMLAHGAEDMGAAAALSHAVIGRAKDRKGICIPSVDAGPMRLLAGMDRGLASSVMECLTFTNDIGFRKLIPEGHADADGAAYLIGFAARWDGGCDPARAADMLSSVMGDEGQASAQDLDRARAALTASAWAGDDAGCAAALLFDRFIHVVGDGDDGMPAGFQIGVVKEAFRLMMEGYPDGFVAELAKSSGLP